MWKITCWKNQMVAAEFLANGTKRLDQWSTQGRYFPYGRRSLLPVRLSLRTSGPSQVTGARVSAKRCCLCCRLRVGMLLWMGCNVLIHHGFVWLLRLLSFGCFQVPIHHGFLWFSRSCLTLSWHLGGKRKPWIVLNHPSIHEKSRKKQCSNLGFDQLCYNTQYPSKKTMQQSWARISSMLQHTMSIL